jgi:hypothetical protein
LQCLAHSPDGFRHIPKTLVHYTQTWGAADGICTNSNYMDWAETFSTIFELHKDDPYMKDNLTSRLPFLRRLEEAMEEFALSKYRKNADNEPFRSGRNTSTQ